jgi:hypothetical protein
MTYSLVKFSTRKCMSEISRTVDLDPTLNNQHFMLIQYRPITRLNGMQYEYT